MKNGSCRAASASPPAAEGSSRRDVRRRALSRWCARVALFGLTLAAVAWGALRLVPLPDALFQPPPAGLDLLDRHGRTLREVPLAENAFLRPAPLEQISPNLVRATLAAEDKRFWTHPGVDWRATLRAAAGWARHGRVVSGGSTLTQQLIKQVRPRPRTLWAKLVEAAQALRLEQVWDKRRILAAYLNRIEYGNRRTGCAAAAAFYFGKPPGQLSVAEATFLAGLPQAPSRLNPHRHFERARQRQHWVLRRMFETGRLPEAEYRRALAEPLRLQPPGRTFHAPHFVDLVLAGAEGATNPSDSPALRTTLDLELNEFVETTLGSHLARLRTYHVGHAAAVVLDNASGDVLALVGSEDYFAPDAGQVNGAWARRSPGSTFKPFTYLLALERGATPASVVADVPAEFPTPTGVFAPVNYDRRCRGPVRYRLALANSLNIPAVRVLDSVGGPGVLQDRLRACGLTTLDRAPEDYGLGLTLGNAEARLLELANAYACLARLGEYRPCRLTLDSGFDVQGSKGKAQGSRAPVGRRVFDAGAAWLIADILSDNAARAPALGLDSPLRFEFPVACKTGTSSDFRDNWALGYTPEFTVGVWVGNFDGSPMERVSGATGAAPILHDLLEHLHARHGTSWYARPSNVVERFVHPITGRLLRQETAGAVREFFMAGALPPLEAPEDYDAAGRVRLGAEYRDWFASADNDLAGRVVVDSAAPGLRLVSPLPGTVYFLDPDVPTSARLRLRAHGAAALRWWSDSLECRTERGEPCAVLTEGRHRLTVQDTTTGEQLETWIEVKRL